VAFVYRPEAVGFNFNKEINKLFIEIKKHVMLREHLVNITDSSITKAGEGAYRANPCPICGHRDCFTIYDSNQTFHCFSCGKSGDIIHLEKYMNGLGSNLEAARSLARKYQITNQERYTRMNELHAEKNVGDTVTIPHSHNKRLLALRNHSADYFHTQLLDNQKALDYLLNVRKHSLDVVKTFRIGVSGGNLIAHATENGYTATDLEEIGLIRKNNRGYSQTIPDGLYVFPHTRDWDVLFYTIKDPAKKHRFQIKKQFAAPGWLCMNQDALNQSTIIIVEGENDLLSVYGKAKQPNVIATIGNFNTSKILAHLKSHSEGKSFYLAFDNDEAGRGYTKKYTAAILEGGGKVHVVSL